MELSLRTLRRSGAAVASLAVLTLAAAPAHAINPDDTKVKRSLRGVMQLDLKVDPSVDTFHGKDVASGALRSRNARAAVALERFVADSSPDWEISWDNRSDRPHLIQGAGFPLLPGSGNGLSRGQAGLDSNQKVAIPDVERLVRDFMGRYPDVLRVNPAALRLDPTRSTTVGNGRVWFVELQQFYRDVPVEGANVFFRINNGNIIQMGADRIANVNVRMVKRAEREPAFAAVLAKAGITAAQLGDIVDAGTLKIYPLGSAGEKAAEGYRGPAGAGYTHRLVWEFVFRVKGDDATWKAVLDANSRELLQLQDTNTYADVKGGVFPVTNTDPEVIVNFPFAAVTNGTAKVTNASGSYTYGGGTATATLDGQYFRMSDACGSISLSNAVDGNLNFGSSTGTDCVTPGVGGAGNTHASRSGFYHLTNINRKAASYLPSNAWLATKVTSNMNIASTCNAFWNGSTVNFYRSGGGCSNTGELAAVFLHEWGHGMDTNTGGSVAGDNAAGEAVGDTFAFLETKNSCIGHNFQPGVLCHNCTTCTGVRDVKDFSLAGTKTLAKPSNIADDNGPNCDRFKTSTGALNCPYVTSSGQSYRGVMGYQGHCESHIASSANWDLAQSLVAAHGTTQGWQTMDALWYESLNPSKSAYQIVSGGTCNPAAVINGCGATNWYTVYLSADDDNGNLADGTPNGCRIWDAFNAHGIACGSRPACAGGCTPQATANAGPDQAIAPGGSVVIGTPAVSGVTYSWAPGGATTAQITVSPASTTTYTVTATNPCGSATDSVTVTVQSGSVAVYDATLKAPKCGTVGAACDSGASLLLGRSTKGPEPNQPNTVAASVCADGTSGTFHADESNDALKVETVDGTNFAAGKSVRVTAKVWAYSTPSSDKLDLYYAADANAPSWTFIATLAPTVGGAQSLSATYTLPAGSLQAVRANFRYQGAAAPCTTGAYDDHDDLAFAVGGGAVDTTAPTTSVTAPANGATVSGTTVSVTASASDASGVTKVEFYVDGALKSTDTAAPYAYTWNSTTVANGSHTMFTKAYDAANNVGTSATISVTVSNVATPGPQTAVYDATLRAPKCGTASTSCDSGASLLNGRATIGPEPNQPNAIGVACADGTSGTYHVDESNDRLKVSTTDGTALAAGKTVRIDATVWAYSSPASDKLDLYYAANANSPTWTFLTTLTPAAAGAQTLSATYTLPAGALQAVRAQFRYQGTVGTCSTGGYNDRDDLIFAVQ